MNIPLTEYSANWSQREYVACMEAGIGFACHGTRDGLGSYFHYKLPEGCKTVVIRAGRVVETIDHALKPGLDWIEVCRCLMMQRSRV